MNFYKHHIGDYLAATSHLSFVEDAAYCRLLRIFYLNEKPLPAEIKSVQRLSGARTKDEKDAVETVLNEFFVLTEDGWSNKRAALEVAEYHAKAGQSREAGKLGGRPKKKETGTVIKNNPDETGTVISDNPDVPKKNLNQEPEPEPEKEKIKTLPAVAVAKPVSIRHARESALLKNIPDLHPQVAADWLQVRRAKKTPLTETALALLSAQASLAGLTTAQAIAFAAGKGWAGFNARWYANEQGGEEKTHAERTQDFKNQQAEKFYEPLLTMTDDEKREWGFA